ncbi:hypothetical protein MKW94_027934 [Papaver nudicaule]|uniref:Uncharacterized protein n=1 Tax=Papaver nudicaule TaxID=74823 RepID=A0AA41V4D3_PAPNU|nr:hypothetical protein [Papaver nudicaule]
MENKRSMSSSAVLILFLLASMYPVLGYVECTCEAEEQQVNPKQTHLALVYKLAAIGAILLAGGIGVCTPVIGQRFIAALRPDGNIMFLVKAFAAGVLLSTGTVHIWPDSVDDLTSPCLGEKSWGDFPLAGFITMLSAIVTLMAESFFTGFFRRKELKQLVKKENDEPTRPIGDAENQLEVHTHATHGHTHGSLKALSSSDDMLFRHKIITHVLELGIVVHSVIIGIAVGVSRDPSTIKPLIVALTFHQFFEGMGLGGCLTQAEFKNKAVAWMAVCYSLTTPTGIAIGMGIMKSYSETSPAALIVQGSMNAASAGILIYMALVDLLEPVFMDGRLQDNRKLHLGSFLSLVLGAGCMSVIALWA